MSKKKWPIPYKKGSVYFQYHVKDYERARKFYSEVMGFDMTWDGGTEIGWGEFELPAKGAKLGINLVGEGERHQRSGTLTLEVVDLEQTKAYLKSKSVKTTEIRDIPNMVSYFNTKDSEGNPIQIVSDPRVKTD